MKIKRIIYTILLIIWMVIIFMFSNQDGKKSEATSNKITSNVIDTVEVVTKQEITKEEKDNIIYDVRLIVRKSAHFFLYFILGILVFLTFSSYGLKNIILFSILFCFIYACSDEIHQIYSNGRSAQLLDIFIDTCGSSIGIGSCLLIKKYFKKKK